MTQNLDWFNKIVVDIETNWGFDNYNKDYTEEDREAEIQFKRENRRLIEDICATVYPVIAESLPEGNLPPIIAGGFARSYLLGEFPNDIDVFIDTSLWEEDEDFSMEDLIDILLDDIRSKLPNCIIRQNVHNTYEGVENIFNVYNLEFEGGQGVTVQLIFKNDGSAVNKDTLLATFDHSLTLAYYNPEDNSIWYSDKYVKSLEEKVIEVYFDCQKTFDRVDDICAVLGFSEWRKTCLYQIKAKKCFPTNNTKEKTPTETLVLSAPLPTDLSKIQEQDGGIASLVVSDKPLTQSYTIKKKNHWWIN